MSEIRVATRADAAAVVRTVVRAFRDDPAFNFFFPSDDEYATQAPLFVEALFDARVDHNTVWVLPDAAGGSQIASLAMWSPPAAGAHESDLSALSDASLGRLRTYGAATHEGLPEDGIWYLGILATDPEHWGQRHGRRLMEPGLRLTAAAGLPAYLETTKTRNVEMYQRSGWEVTNVIPVDAMDVTFLRHEGMVGAAAL